jgi:ketosteroid isomerase-like protein
MKKYWRVAVPIAFCLTILTLSCTQQQEQPASDTRATDEAAIRAAETAWSKVAAAKQTDATVAYYADDATLLAPNAPMVSDKQSIRKTWTEMFATPGFSISWQGTKVEIARSGDIGYTVGTYQMGMHDPKGNPMTDRGKYVTVWRKQPDGTWKAIVDTFNTDLPAAPAETK